MNLKIIFKKSSDLIKKKNFLFFLKEATIL